MGHSNCHSEDRAKKNTYDILLIGTSLVIIFSLIFHLYSESLPESVKYLSDFSGSIFEQMNKIWLGILIGILSVGLLSKVSKEYILAILGKGNKISGIIRATLAGMLLDICNHGILMVGMKLYERGASIGQVVAFLVASPWNSFSLTVILYLLIGLKWTLAFIAISMLIAIISGIIFNLLEKKGFIPKNPNQIDLAKDFHPWEKIRKNILKTKFSFVFVKEIIGNGFKDSRMVLRWIFLGVILAALMRTFLSPENFQSFFGPSLAGLGLTVIVATVIEVCSEGSVPIAADILTRANAPGNAFAFLMTGVSTDYTEIMSLKDTTKSWKIAWFLPLVTVPQVILISWLINQFSSFQASS